jgi:penicillin amidase
MAVAVLVAGAVATPSAGAAAPGPRAKVVLPPGEGNTVNMTAFLANQASGDCADLGPHVCDQLRLYKNWRFRHAPLSATPGDVPGAVSDEQPAAGVDIVRDGHGVPHVFARGPSEQTIEERISYGVGYAQAEERLFQMEILRRAAEGRLSDLLGPDYVEMDVVTRRDTETAAEQRAALATLPSGQRRSLRRYADGINAVIARDSGDLSQMPAGFTLTQDLPIQPWTPRDTLAVITLEVKGVAESAGNELGYGSLARRLAGRYGLRRAAGILDDLQLTRDPHSPTTVPHGQAALRTSDGRRYRFIRYSPGDTERRIAALHPDIERADRAMLSGDQAVARATETLGLPVFGSNAWAISPRRSATGGALLWGGPQVGYYVPPVFDEIEIEGGHTRLRGVGVPGGGPGIAIGYTPRTAWTITTAQDDQVDTYVDRIRPVQGGRYQYRWHGSWHRMGKRTVTIRSRVQTAQLPLTGALDPPTYTDHTATYYRTLHGPPGAPLPCIVVYLDSAAGRSYCKVRAFWNKELQTGRSLVDVNKARGLGAFDRAVRRGIAGFNFIYADDAGHIGYWHTGRVPVRVRGHDPRLPVPGNGRFDWRGFLSPRAWPSVVDPAQGFVASWNNKPQRSWLDSGDGSLWGGYQRVREPMMLLARHRRRFTPDGVWRIARRTGELDLRATLGFKRFLTRLSGRSLSPIERAAIAQVRRWDGTAFYPDGAERTSSGTETGKIAAAGFPILNAWFHALEARVGAPVFGPVVGGPGIAAGVRHFTQTPPTTSPKYEFFDDYDAFLFNVLSGRAGGAPYLGRRSVDAVSRAALRAAVKRLRAAKGADPARWRAPMPQISFMALDVAGIGTIPWENRGTWGEALALPAKP